MVLFPGGLIVPLLTNFEPSNVMQIFTPLPRPNAICHQKFRMLYGLPIPGIIRKYHLPLPALQFAGNIPTANAVMIIFLIPSNLYIRIQWRDMNSDQAEQN